MAKTLPRAVARRHGGWFRLCPNAMRPSENARAVLAHGGTPSAIERGHSRDGHRREWRLFVAVGDILADVTAAVAALTRWLRRRKGGGVLDRHGYDGLARLADALLAHGQYIGTVQ